MSLIGIVLGVLALITLGPPLFFVLLAALDPNMGAKGRHWR